MGYKKIEVDFDRFDNFTFQNDCYPILLTMASVKTPRACRCGSTTHFRTNHSSCPLNKKAVNPFSCPKLFQADSTVSEWGSIALDSSKEFHKLCEMLATSSYIRNFPDCPNFPFWDDWMTFSYYINDIKNWCASNPKKAIPLFIKLKEINEKNNPKPTQKPNPKPIQKPNPKPTQNSSPKPTQNSNPKPRPKFKIKKSKVTINTKAKKTPKSKEEKGKKPIQKRKRHPSGRREKRLQRLWEGEKGLKWVGETKRLKSHPTYRSHCGTPHGLKWLERGGDAPGEWHVYYARPNCPKKNPEKESRILWDEYGAQWVKSCSCQGDESQCVCPGLGSAPCVCFT